MGGNMKEEKLKKGESVAWKSGFLIVGLSLIEALIGLFSNSLILLSDALHNIGDSLAFFASSLGLKISQRKPSEKFPYGYYKAENLAAFIVSLFIIYAAIELIQEGYSQLFTLPQLSMPFEALAIAAVSIILSFFLAKYVKRVGKAINSQALIANAEERFAHVFSGSIVFLVILLSYFKIPYIESLATIGFSILILKTGIFSLKDSIFSLMDVAPSKDLIQKIKKLITSTQGVEELKGLRLRRAGPFIFGEATIKVQKHIQVEKAHSISEEIEKKVKAEIENLDSLIIHLEPFEKEEVKVALPIKKEKGLNSILSEHLGRRPKFMFLWVNLKTKEIKDFYTKNNPARREAVRAGLQAAKFLLKERVNVVITKEIGEISFHTLRDNLVEIYKTERKTVREAIEDFFNKKLKRMEKPSRKEEESIFRTQFGRWRGRRWKF